ncbi:MAG: alpha/beta fold hydrolase [Chthoniobacterales bacterium]
MSQESRLEGKQKCHIGVSVGAGLGIGLLGALALALRFGWKNRLSGHIPDAISPAVFATRVIDTTPGEIVYHTSGSGDPLLFLHGVFPGASSFEWSKVYPYFATSHHVLVPDLIGFGESQRPRIAISVEDQVRSLAEFLEATTEKPATIIASGLNANIALLLAARHPNKVARLLLWMPLLAFNKYISLSAYHRLTWFPQLARVVYDHQWSTPAFIKSYLLRSGFSANEPLFEEALSVFVSTAQQCGAKHAFLAQSSPKFWRLLHLQPSSLTLPVALLTPRGSERLTKETISILHPLVHRFSITEVEAASTLAPLSEPAAVIKTIAAEISSTN